jgi:hypothetical protein
VSYSQTPVTVDGREIPPDAPRSQGMDDATAQGVVTLAEDHRAAVLHLDAAVTGNTATITVANASPGQQVYLDFGDGNGLSLDLATGGTETTADHLYLNDGVYVAQVFTLSGPPAQAHLEIAINWPAPFPDDPQPAPEA